MNAEQYTYLRTRRKLLKSWNTIGIVALLIVVSIFLLVLLNSPILINPFEAIIKVEQGVLEQTTLEMIAIILPIIVIMFFILLIVIIGMIYLSFSNEKKYIKIIQGFIKSESIIIKKE